VRRLIINADDFGLTAGVNRAVVEAHGQGIVTSATLMANAEACDDATEMARSLTARGDQFSVGCHVVLLDGEPLLPAERVRSLLQADAGNGTRLRTSLSQFVIASLRNKLNPDEVEAEANAQMERIQRAGVQLSHFDTHKHAHMFPAVLRPLLRAARARNIGAVRNPFGQVWPLPLSSLVRTRQAWKRLAQLNVLRSFAAGFRREVAAHGLRTPDGSVGVLVTGVLDLQLFTAIVASIPEGTWEFVTHPGYNDAGLARVQTRLRQSREQELHLLTSPEAKELLQREGIELISYREL
jgi:predicted glycoside hydrolase/deacetylase ChbG (UPF0249 family)